MSALAQPDWSAPFRIGVDGGGTATRARLTDIHGHILGEGLAGASGLMQGTAQAWRNIRLAIERALAVAGWAGTAPPPPDALVLGIGVAGANNPAWLADFLAANPGFHNLTVESDAYTALLGAHGSRPGVLAIVGTGSIALARLSDGSRRTTGGWGFPSGDEGSGAHLGLQAAKLAQQAADGRRPHGALSRAVLAATGGSAGSLLSWCCKAGQRDYATLAPLVFDTEAEDPMAGVLLGHAVQSVEHLIRAVDTDGRLPLALWGSVGLRLIPRLGDIAHARLVVPAGDALDGALALCFKSQAGERV